MKDVQPIPENDMVSVIIPTYNRAGVVARAIKSALAQTYRNVEVIVVDDGSTDETPDEVKTFEGQGAVRYIRQRNKGVAAARNTGMKAAEGKWIGFLDSDDYWFPWKLETQVRILRALPEVGLIFSDYCSKDHRGFFASYIREYYPILRRANSGFREIFLHAARLPDLIEVNEPMLSSKLVYWGNVFLWELQGNFISTSTVVGRRTLFLELGGMDESLRTGEDADFYLRFCLRHPIAYLNASAGMYTAAGENRLSDFGTAMRQNWSYSLDKVLRELPQDFLVKHKQLIARTLSERSYKLAISFVKEGKVGESRKCLINSLRQSPFYYKSLLLLAASFIPLVVLRLCYRWVQKTMGVEKIAVMRKISAAWLKIS